MRIIKKVIIIIIIITIIIAIVIIIIIIIIITIVIIIIIIIIMIENIKKVSERATVTEIQKICMLGSARILKKVLSV